MNKEQAINRIKFLKQDDCSCPECEKNKEAYDVVLNYIKELQEENYTQKNIISSLTTENIEQISKDFHKSLEKYMEHESMIEQKIRDKIEELNNLEASPEDIFFWERIKQQQTVLKELLEK